jgi:hypothetical protein
MPLDLGQQRREVEPVGAGGPRRCQIGARPVAGFGCQLGVEPAGKGAVAVMLMISQEARQIAQLGLRTRGERATTVAIGAERRAMGQRGVAKLSDVGLLERLKSPSGVGILPDVK